MNPHFSAVLRTWYRKERRNLPWRNTTDPYKIWISEVILQQTRVQQGLRYYYRFLEAFPDVQSLASAKEDQVMKMWQGLGYYSRARNMHFAARQICSEFNGVFPDTYQQIRRLKGVGDYTAAAISSFAFNLPHAVVDGNVYRVLSRYFGIEEAIDSSAGKKLFAALASDLISGNDPAEHNQALMEFGAIQCVPANPDCISCPLSAGCSARKNKQVNQLPYKKGKVQVKERFFNYVVLADKNNKIRLRRRQQKDIWQGLYEFDLIEGNSVLKSAEVKKRLKAECGVSELATVYESHTYRHVLTHQRLNARFFVFKANALHGKDCVTGTVSELQRFAFPRLIDRFLEEHDLTEIL